MSSYLIGVYFVLFQSRGLPEHVNPEMSVGMLHPNYHLTKKYDKFDSLIDCNLELNVLIESCYKSNNIDLSRTARTSSQNYYAREHSLNFGIITQISKALLKSEFLKL